MSSPNPLGDFFEVALRKQEELTALAKGFKEMKKLPYDEGRKRHLELVAEVARVRERSIVSSESQRTELKDFIHRNIGSLLVSLGKSPQKLGIDFRGCTILGVVYSDESPSLVFRMRYAYPFRLSRDWFGAAASHYLGPFGGAAGNPFLSKIDREAETILVAIAKQMSFASEVQNKLKISDCKTSFLVMTSFGGDEPKVFEEDWPDCICIFSENELNG